MFVIPNCTPELRRCPNGWLAVTPAEHPYRIGVIGHTEEDAKSAFSTEMDAWRDLHDYAQAERTRVDRAGGR
jgi:hypothetical protein